MTIEVTEEMVDAAIEWLNRERGSEESEVAMSWGDILRGAYLVMEETRRTRMVRNAQASGTMMIGHS